MGGEIKFSERVDLVSAPKTYEFGAKCRRAKANFDQKKIGAGSSFGKKYFEKL
jgi:hypothetical protein